MAKKFYAVKSGRKTGIYESWEECKEQVDGFSGASYKSFPARKLACDFLGIIDDVQTGIERSGIAEAIAYVDGSFNNKSKEFSFGVIIFHDQIEERFAEIGSDPNLVAMRNVAGEIQGAEKAMKFCIENGIASLDLHYDYEGIEKWCTGEWKAKKEGTKAYKEFYNGIKNELSVNFIKVKSHSGDTYNELADELAKSALGIISAQEITHTDNNMTAKNIEFGDLMCIVDLLNEEIKDLKVSPCSIPYGEGFYLSVKEPKRQKLKVVHFADKSKLWVQGKREELFNRFSTYLIELLETEDVSEFLNTVHNLHIKKVEIESEFELYFPNAIGQLPEKLNNYLHQAVYNLRIQGNVYNATFLVEPAIRPLEALIKIALQDNDIPIREDGNKYDSFFVFYKEHGICKLNSNYITSSHSEAFIEYIERCYNHYNKNRHTLSHWDNPSDSVDTTRIIKSVYDAHMLIKDTLCIIDEYYSL
ncbi:hypothetical protein SANA_12290 [Gottschalkiaceae bacterium SANA]|nr:hypothetical protein SANA_12290 [Gottschalkiaceae bacterium SANA]